MLGYWQIPAETGRDWQRPAEKWKDDEISQIVTEWVCEKVTTREASKNYTDRIYPSDPWLITTLLWTRLHRMRGDWRSFFAELRATLRFISFSASSFSFLRHFKWAINLSCLVWGDFIHQQHGFIFFLCLGEFLTQNIYFVFSCDARAAQLVTMSLTVSVCLSLHNFLKQLYFSQFKSDLSEIWILSLG